MADPTHRSKIPGKGQEEAYVYRTRQLNQMELPDDDELAFREVQSFDQIWLWALMGLELVVILIPLILTKQPWSAFLGMGMVMLLTFVFLGSLRLKTRIDDEGVHFRMSWFHMKDRTIPWDDIDQIYVRKYSPIMEYGGWGVRRFSRNGRAYSVKGNYGIQIVKKDGKKILLGTQSPAEASRYLSRHPLLV
jgi:hypothetical protein